MSGATGAIVGSAVLAAGATAYAGSEQSKSQAAANKANAKNADATNRANLEMFYESRGAGGSSILPIYARDDQGEQVEPKLFADALGVYDATGTLSPAQLVARNQEIVDRMAGAQAGADETVRGVYDNTLTNQALAENEPVAQARTDLAVSKKNASIEALNRTLNEIKAIQARKGFVGDTSTSRRLEFGARRDAATQGAVDIGSANLMNASDRAAIQERGRMLKLSSLDLPYNQTRRSIDVANLPNDVALDQTARRQAVFNTFRIGPQAFQYQPLPQVQPVAGTGQIVGQAVGQLAGTAGNLATNYYLNKQQQENNLELIKALNRPGATTLGT